MPQIHERMLGCLAPPAAESTPASGPAADLSRLAELTRQCGERFGHIGRLPPAPNTLRARIGKVLVRAVSRMLFWYTPQIVAYNDLVARLAAEQLGILRRVAESLAQLAAEGAAWRQHAERQIAALTAEDAALRRDSEQQAAALAAENSALRASLAELRTGMHREQERLREQVERADKRDREAHAQAAARIERQETAEQHLRERTAELDRVLTRIRYDVTAQDQRFAALAIEWLRGRDDSGAPPQAAVRHENSHRLDALYLNFENLFRGTREDIKERQRVYLPRFRGAGLGSPEMPVLDVGCGRGEWLELLRDEGLCARGVDLNRMMVAECRARGLEAVEGDVIPSLRTLPDACLGALTGFHIIEHIPLTALVDLLDETLRLLKPGGLALFETPNPSNLLVGAYTFYFDPTHRNPLPAPTMAFLAEARGLRQVEIFPLHPLPPDQRLPEDGSELARRLNEYFSGPQDYAIIGRKI